MRLLVCLFVFVYVCACWLHHMTGSVASNDFLADKSFIMSLFVGILTKLDVNQEEISSRIRDTTFCLEILCCFCSFF